MKKKRGKTTPKTRRRTARTYAPVSSSKKRSKPQRKHSAPKLPKHRRQGRKARHGELIPKPVLIEETIKRPPHEMMEEVYAPSPIHRGKYRIPVGIRFLIGYLTFLAVLYLISFVYGITFPTTILFGKMITGTRALIINIVLLLLIFAMIYGFWKRKAYTFDLAIGFFSFTALNAVISLMMFESAEHPMFKKLLLLSFVSLVFMNIVIIWYVLHERKYFYAEQFKDRPVHHRDKVFLYIIIAFWTLTLLIGITLGVNFYKGTKLLIDESIAELKGDYYTGIIKCEQKTGPERDVCTLVIATILSEKMDPAQSSSSHAYAPKEDLEKLCNTIQSDFYRFTCMRSIDD